jgi:hypothetical protein
LPSTRRMSKSDPELTSRSRVGRKIEGSWHSAWLIAQLSTQWSAAVRASADAVDVPNAPLLYKALFKLISTKRRKAA